MIRDDFSIRLQGIPSSEIARYAQFAVKCPDCGAKPGVACNKPKVGRQTCQSRFIAALRQLARVGEEAILQQFDWLNSWDK